MLKRSLLALSIAQVLVGSAVWADDVVKLNTIVIYAENGTNDVLDQQALTKQQPKDIKAVFDDVAGVNVVDIRAGQIGDIEIRGMGGTSATFGTGSSRVGLELDGMEISQSFNFGHGTTHGRQYFDTADLKQVEIEKGPSGNGIAGNVKFRTKNPIDYLQADQTIGGQARLGYNGSTNEYSAGLSLAGKFSEAQSASLSYTQRQYHEFENNGGLKSVGASRTANNPLDGVSHSILGKWVYTPDESSRVSLNLQHYHSDLTITHLNRVGEAVSSRNPAIRYLNSYYDAQNVRSAAAINYETWERGATLFDDATISFSIQQTDSKIKNESQQQNTATQAVLTPSSFDHFTVRLATLKLDFDKSFGKRLRHQVHYGMQAKYNQTSTQSSATQNFPNTTSYTLKGHVENRISSENGAWGITPSLDVTHMRIRPEAHESASIMPYWSRGQAITLPKAQDYNKTAVGGGLAIDYALNATNTVAFNYRYSVRLPNFGETNGAYYGHWIGKPNPSLKPETAHGYELNWQTKGRFGYQQTTLFYDIYHDMIDVAYTQNKFNSPDAEAIIYNVNGKTTGYGIEWAGRFDFGALNWVEGLALKANVAYAQGKDYRGKKRAKLDPLTGSIALEYDHSNQKWGVSGLLRFAAAKKQQELEDNIQPLSGYHVLNLTGYYNITERLKLSAGVYNVLDKKYAMWSKVRGINTQADYTRYHEAGRYFGANLTYNF